jgi:histidinol dehydrogenase
MSGTINIGPVENHRGREEGAMVYPVYSRRSKGLSVGVNLFPDRKVCSFDCPYCEVFPFSSDIVFSVEVMERALKAALADAKVGNIPVRDICFSGNGEPTMSPHFDNAMEAAARIRDTHARDAALVLITNGTGLLNNRTFDLLRSFAAGPAALAIWLKLDAGTPDWYAAMDRSGVPYDELISRIRQFVTLAPVTIQTMLCAVDGKAPPEEEAEAWEHLVTELAASADRAAGPANAALSRSAAPGQVPGIRGIQLYGKARPAPEDPLAEALPVSYLEHRALSLRSALNGVNSGTIPVEVFP